MLFLILWSLIQFALSCQETDPYKQIEKLITEKKYEQASSTLNDLTKKDENNPKIYNLTAMMYRSMGGSENIRIAESYYYKLYSNNKEDKNVELELGICSYLLGHKEKARLIFNSIHKTNKMIKELNYYMGCIAFDDNNMMLAREYFKKELEINKSNVDALFMLGTSYEHNDKSEAIKYYSRALELDPSHIASLFNLSLAYSMVKDQDKAIQAANKLLQIEEAKNIKGTVYYNLACFYSLKKQEKNSIENLKKAIENGFNDFEHAKKDADLKFLRDKRDFKELIK